MLRRIVLSSLTPSTIVMSGFLAGAVMTTFFAPAVTWRSRNHGW